MAEPVRHSRPLPGWFVAGLVATTVWCATAGAVGIALLTVGWYQPSVVGGGATLAALAASFAAVRGLGPRDHADHGAALAAVVLALAFLVLAGAFHSEHLLHDRDPAIYITTGRSIARTHELRPKTHVEVFRDPAFGYPDSRFQPDFFPMLPVLLALGWSIGGVGAMLLVGSFLGSVGLLACYALAARVVGARRALFVLLFLMIAPLQLWFARDAYSELVVQVLVLAGLWLFLEARARNRFGVAMIGGALVAASTLARVDVLAITAGVLAFAGLAWVRCDSDAMPPPARRTVMAFTGTLVGGTLVALATTYGVAHRYVTSLGGEYRQLVAAFVASVLGVVAVVVVHRLRPGLGRRLATVRYLFPTLLVGSVAVFVWAYALRPDPARDLPVSRPGHPATGAVRTAIFEWHFSRSLHWFSAYIGLVGIVVAFVGFVVLAARARHGREAAAAVFLVAIPTAVLYIARPSIQPGQPWAMRRYLPVVIPGIAIAVVVALDAGWQLARSARAARVRAVATAGVVVVVLLVATPTAWAARPLVTARMQHGAEAAIDHVCDVADPDAALLVYGNRTTFVGALLEALRAFCGVPVANSSAVDLPVLARQWREFGRRLVVVTSVPRTVSDQAPGATVVGHYVVSDDDDPEKVYDRAPRRYAPSRFEIWLLQIPAAAA